jgi:hypothetical protein
VTFSTPNLQDTLPHPEIHRRSETVQTGNANENPGGRTTYTYTSQAKDTQGSRVGNVPTFFCETRMSRHARRDANAPIDWQPQQLGRVTGCCGKENTVLHILPGKSWITTSPQTRVSAADTVNPPTGCGSVGGWGFCLEWQCRSTHRGVSAQHTAPRAHERTQHFATESPCSLLSQIVLHEATIFLDTSYLPTHFSAETIAYI